MYKLLAWFFSTSQGSFAVSSKMSPVLVCLLVWLAFPELLFSPGLSCRLIPRALLQVDPYIMHAAEV